MRNEREGSFQPFTRLGPIKACITFQADEILRSDLFNLLTRYIRPDPFELCLRPALSTLAHGSPVTVSIDGSCRKGPGQSS